MLMYVIIVLYRKAQLFFIIIPPLLMRSNVSILNNPLSYFFEGLHISMLKSYCKGLTLRNFLNEKYQVTCFLHAIIVVLIDRPGWITINVHVAPLFGIRILIGAAVFLCVAKCCTVNNGFNVLFVS